MTRRWKRGPARPLGASFADWMGKPKIVGGLGWGSGNVSLTLTSIIAVAVGVLALLAGRSNRDVRP